MRVWLSKNETFFWNFEPPWSRVFYANRAAVPGCFLLQFRHFFECISKDTIFFKRLCNILFCHKIIDLNCFKSCFHWDHQHVANISRPIFKRREKTPKHICCGSATIFTVKSTRHFSFKLFFFSFVSLSSTN